MTWRRASRWIGVLAVLPCVLPLLSLGHFYNSDWFHHLWASGYAGNYLRAHFSLPVFASTDEFWGYPIYPFYGHWLYWGAGLVSALVGGGATGAELGLRLFCGAGFVAQAFAARKASRVWLGSSLEADAISWLFVALVGWAIYPLTMLYNAAMVPNVVAMLFLVTGFLSWAWFLGEASQAGRATAASVAGFSWAFGLGIHPISTLLGVPAMGVLVALVTWAALPSWRGDRGRRSEALAALAGACVFVALTDASFFYALGRLSSGLGATGLFGIQFDKSTTDSVLHRLFPLPLDKRSLLGGTSVATPYLDTQINMPLLALAALFVWGAWRERSRQVRRFRPLWVAVAGVGLTLMFSLSESAYLFAPKLLQSIQFPSRLISLVNLFLVASVMLLFLGCSEVVLAFARRRAGVAALALLVGWTGASLGMKLVHVASVRASKAVLGRNPEGSFLRIPEGLPTASYRSRAVQGLPGEVEVVSGARFQIDRGQKFGSLEPLSVRVRDEAGGWFGTNISASQWHHVFDQGHEVPGSALRARQDRLAVELRGVGEHRLTVESRMDPGWTLLHRLGVVAWFFGMGLAGLKFFPSVQKRWSAWRPRTRIRS